MKSTKSILVISLLVASLCLAGCASSSSQPMGSVARSKVASIPMGTPESEVAAFLGRPRETSSSITSAGTQRVWLYSLGDLIERLEGFGAAFGYGFQAGMGGGAGTQPVRLTFTDGRLSAIDGL